MTAVAASRMDGSGGDNGYGNQIVRQGGAMMQTRSSFVTAIAVQKPRQLAQVQNRLIEEANLAGEEFYYGWGAGKDKIEGASVELALSAARCWGNCAVELAPMQETDDAWVFTANFVDLETGFTLARQFRQSKKWTVHGKFDEERKSDIRFQIGQSKAIRNVVLNALPASIINRAMDAAKDGVRTKMDAWIKEKSLPAVVDIILRALAKLGVDEPRVLAKIGVADKKALDLEMLVTLKGDMNAIETGREWADSLFPKLEADTAGKPLEDGKGAFGFGAKKDAEQKAPQADQQTKQPPQKPQQTTPTTTNPPEQTTGPQTDAGAAVVDEEQRRADELQGHGFDTSTGEVTESQGQRGEEDEQSSDEGGDAGQAGGQQQEQKEPPKPMPENCTWDQLVDFASTTPAVNEMKLTIIEIKGQLNLRIPKKWEKLEKKEREKVWNDVRDDNFPWKPGKGYGQT